MESPIDAYNETFNMLKEKSGQEALTEQLKPESAADGDSFEIMKFLIALLNEVRISYPVLLESNDLSLSDEDYEHIESIFIHLDQPENWDPVDSWPAILFQGLSKSNNNSFFTPKVIFLT